VSDRHESGGGGANESAGHGGAVQPAENTGRLFDAIGERAAEERAAARARADERIREITAAADARIARQEAAARRAMEKELLVQGERLRGEVRMQWRAEQLAMKRRLLAEVFARAGAEVEILCGAPGEVRAEALRALAAEAAAAAGEPCTVTVDPATATVVVVSGDGARRVDNSPRERLRRAQSAGEAQVAALLFPGQDSP
jgi:vacuolar-type H+-ATPase subunit E/Vma4